MHPALNQQMQAARVLELSRLAHRPAPDAVAAAPRRRLRLSLRHRAAVVRPRPALSAPWGAVDERSAASPRTPLT